MKVLHVQKVRGIAGSENYLFQILPALRRAGVDASFLSLVEEGDEQKNVDFDRRLSDLGIPARRARIGKYPTPQSLRELSHVIDAVGPDLVHTHLIHADTHVAALGLLRPGMRQISTKHGYEESFNNEFGFDASRHRRDLYYWLSRFVENRTRRSYAISDGLRRFFVEAGMSRRDHLDRIHYGFDFKAVQLDPAREKYRFAEHQLCIVGRLVRFKGHRYAIEALARVRRELPNTKLVVVGGGALDQELRAEAAREGVGDAVEFVGFKSNVHDYMAASDVVLVPSISEGFGVVFLEAFRNDRPVVAFDVPAANELIVDGVSGFLVPPYDVARYAGRISELLRDPELRARLAGAAKRRLEEYFTAERMTRETVALYERVLRD